MSSINQIISELAHSVKQADSVPVRNALKLSIIHARNKLIRQSYEQHSYADRGLHQRVKISLTDVTDGDIKDTTEAFNKVKRSTNKVPKPTRFTNNTPFQAVHTIGFEHNIEIPFAKESSSRFYSNLPGLCTTATYDYINGYIYINTTSDKTFRNLEYIIVESVFETPQMLDEETIDGIKLGKNNTDDDEFLIPEDMVEDLKNIVLSNFNAEVIRNTNVIPNQTKVM